MVAAGAFFVGSMMLIPLLPTGFIPPDDNSQTQVYLELPPGSTLAQTTATAEAARAADHRSVDTCKSVYTTIGGGVAGSDPFAPAGAAETRKATLTILLTDARRHARASRASKTRSAPRWKRCPACAARSAWAARARNTSWC